MQLSFLKAMALSGGDWVIYALLLSSVVAVAIIIERWLLLSKEEKQFADLRRELVERLGEELPALEKAVRRHEGAAGRILKNALAHGSRGGGGIEDAMVAASLEEKARLEYRLLWLGTLGNNAPFIGLFGTVLGVIKAFNDLADTGAGPEVVMRGLSEALLATAVGLFVAIPCVIGYNVYQKKVRDILAGTESLGRSLLARIRA